MDNHKEWAVERGNSRPVVAELGVSRRRERCWSGYGTWTVVHVGLVMEITPPQLHMHFDELLSAGMFSTRTVGEPGAHGADVAGMHGIGVSTPSAADVAAATVGFARL